jgi:chromate reductase, NAD(P)H dehydrogenase (quinone)
MVKSLVGQTPALSYRRSVTWCVGTAVAQAHLRSVLGCLKMATLGQPEVYIQFTQGLIDDEGNIKNDGTRKFLQGFVDRYADWIAKFV